MPAGGWMAVLKRTWTEAGADNLSLIASGVSFYGFLALVPLLGALVMSYGLFASPAAVVGDFKKLTAVLPPDAARLIGEQLMNVVGAASSKKGLALLVALAVALWGAMKGASAILIALNIAYDEQECRGFARRTLLALAMTLGAIAILFIAAFGIAALSSLGDLLPGAPGVLVWLGKLLTWLLLAAIGAAGAATLYRYGPSRDEARWVWLTPGSVAASVGWGLLSLGFGVYVANFGHYNATYGSLGAVVVLLTWMYLSAYVLLLGAELNAELEHQTGKDTTAGPQQPIGSRGAKKADTVAGEKETDDGREKARAQFAAAG